MDRDNGLRECAHRFFQRVWNEKEPDALEGFLSPDFIKHGLGAESPLNRDGYLRFYKQFLAAFPDAKFTVEHVLVESERVAVQYRVQATHLGSGLGFAATGRKVGFTAMSVSRWKDGRILEMWSNFDQLGLLRQLGMAD